MGFWGELILSLSSHPEESWTIGLVMGMMAVASETFDKGIIIPSALLYGLTKPIFARDRCDYPKPHQNSHWFDCDNPQSLQRIKYQRP